MRPSKSKATLSPAALILAIASIVLLRANSNNSVSAFVPTSTLLTHSATHSTALYSDRASSETSHSAFSGDPHSDGASYGLRSSEFHSLEPINESEARRLRRKQDERTRARFATFGDELWDLRSKVVDLSTSVLSAMKSGNEAKAQSAREKLKAAERRDPELVYELQLAALFKAEREGKEAKAEAHKDEANAARSCLPHFNLEGLWVGKYGDHGYEMINVTYSGDLLTAYKVTGDNNVPRGEITFQADLSPLSKTRSGETKKDLKPIVLTESAAKKWGTTQLPRYAGSGQVAEDGFTNKQWMDGQLIMIGESYFSFAWLPISHQIFFGRPSPELALKMLREAGTTEVKGIGTPPPAIEDDDVSAMRAFVSRCLDETAAHIEDEIIEGKSDAFSCIWAGQATEECYFQ